MASVELFSTSILSNHKVRSRHERYVAVLGIKKIAYVYHDLASDDEAKSRWRRKAKDQQLPGLLVNNEWIGGFDEFEEAVEYGELELFLGVSAQASQPQQVHPAQLATTSKDASLYPSLPHAPEGSGRRSEPTADEFVSALGLTDADVNDADVDSMLAGIETLASKRAKEQQQPPRKHYVPSEQAAIKPLRLAKMGDGKSAGTSIPQNGLKVARYSEQSAKALAAEAAALTSNRKATGSVLREAVAKGQNLDDAMAQSNIKNVVGQDDLDDLFASLGLQDVDIDDAEVDDFLSQGAVPHGLTTGGHRTTSSQIGGLPSLSVNDEVARPTDPEPVGEADVKQAQHVRSTSTASSKSDASALRHAELTSSSSADGVDTHLFPLSVEHDIGPSPTLPEEETDTEGVEQSLVLADKVNDGHQITTMNGNLRIPDTEHTPTQHFEIENASEAKSIGNVDERADLTAEKEVDLSHSASEGYASQVVETDPTDAATTELRQTIVDAERPAEITPEADVTSPSAALSSAILLPSAVGDDSTYSNFGEDAIFAIQYAQREVTPSTSFPSGLAASTDQNGGHALASSPSTAASRSPKSPSVTRGRNEGASSPRTSPSTRKAIDVARPVVAESDSSAPSTPQSKKRGMSIGGFRLGKDKEPKSPLPATPSPAAGAGPPSTSPKQSAPARHERTISQILREADAVLGLDEEDDYSGDRVGGGLSQDDDYHGIFGSSGDTDYTVGGPPRQLD